MFGWAFLGCGNIARQVADELSGTGTRIVSCWNRTPQRAREFAERYGCEAYPSPEQALSAPGVDGAYIAVTADSHFAYMQKALSCGTPVLCEKPFAVNVGEAERAFSLARSRGLYLAEAMWTWFNSPAQTVRRWIGEGKIGKVVRVAARYAERYIDIPRFSSPALLGGALVDIGVYPIRYCYELFGMPRSVVCRGSLVGGVDRSEWVTLGYDGFSAELDISVEESRGEEMTITGTEGEIVIPAFHCAREALLSGRESAHHTDDAPKYGVQMRRAAEEIAAGRRESAFSTPQATLDTMRLLDECRRQLGLVYPCERK